MRRHVVCAGILAAATAAMAVDVPLTFIKHGPKEAPSFEPYGYALLEESAKLPPGTWKLPVLKAKLPVYALAELGSSKRLLVLDVKEAADPFYTRLRFDANGNGDLTDDPAIDIDESEGRPSNVAEFPPIEVNLTYRGGVAPYRLSAFAYFMGSPPPEGGLTEKDVAEQKLRVYLSCECSYHGSVDLDGVTHRVVLNDRNANGRFDDTHVFVTADGATELAGDIFIVTTAAEVTYESANFLCFGNQLVLKDKLYDVALDLAATMLRITPSAAQVVKVEFPGMDIDHMTLASEDGAAAIMLFRPGSAARIPVGSYRPLEYRCLRKDAEGDLWRANAEARPDTPFQKVDATRTKLPFGEPYSVRAVVPEEFYKEYPETEGRGLALEIEIIGAAKEHMTDLRHIVGEKTTIPREKDGVRPVEPTYTILTTNGEIAGKGSFGYG